VVTRPAAWRRAERVVPYVLLPGVLLWCLLGPMGLASGRIHTWSWFHYYLGAKYFPELGYTDLYEQAVAAQREDGGALAGITHVRDLRTYRVVGLRHLPSLGRSEAFSDERWQAFKNDVAALEPRLPFGTWRRVLRDRGYNATPACDTPASWLTGVIDLHNPVHLHLAKWIDVLGLLFMVWLVGRTFGWWPAVAWTLALLLFPATPGRFLGGMVKYDWLIAVTLVPVLLKRDRPMAAGAALGAAACMRVFPALLLGAFLIRGVYDLVNQRTLPRRPLRVLAGFGIAVALGVALGAARPGGLTRWQDFAEGISLHNREMAYGDGRVGLRHIFTHQPGSDRWERPNQRREVFQRQRVWAWGLSALMLGLLVVALRRADEVDAVVMLTIALFALSVTSCYYWAVLAMWALLGRGRAPPPGVAWPALGLALAFAPSLVYWVCAAFQEEKYPQWLVVNGCMLIGFLVVLTARIVRDLRSAPIPR